MKRNGIQNMESRPYHPQYQGKNERSHNTWKNQKETWYIKWRAWYNSFINKLINHECIDNMRNYKSITPQDHVNICKFHKTLLECKLWYLINFLNDYRLISELIAKSSEITFVICRVTHLIRMATKVRLEPSTFYLVNQLIIY